MPTGNRRDFIRVGYDRAENTDTVSSPHTYGGRSAIAPGTTQPDRPTIRNIQISSALAGVPPHLLAKASGKPVSSVVAVSHGVTTRRVEQLTFDMDGVSPPIANLFRRIMITEVPTLAFDRVFIEENDSVVVDELLSHRLGLVPVAGPVDEMEFISQSNQASFTKTDPKRVLVFELEAEGAADQPSTPVYSGQLRWVPLAGQEGWNPSMKRSAPDPIPPLAVGGDGNEAGEKSKRIKMEGAGEALEGSVTNDAEDAEGTSEGGAASDSVFIVHPDILLTKLGPGQKLKLRVMAVKGLGGVHSKWSPVAACMYDMKTSISFREPVRGESAQKLERICPMGVFDVEDGVAVVKDPSNCTLCRECVRRDTYPEFAGDVVLEKCKTSVRFTIESTGQRHAADIFRSALTLFAERTKYLAGLIRSSEVNVIGASKRGAVGA